MIYKVVNVYGNNLTDRFVDEKKINDAAKDGWKLISIIQPPNAQNTRWVCGTFAKDETPRFDAKPIEKASVEAVVGGKK
jgi:hypothetical protein